LLRIEMPCTDADLADLEWIEEYKNYREWLLQLWAKVGDGIEG
jgi:hypothetical protein